MMDQYGNPVEDPHADYYVDPVTKEHRYPKSTNGKCPNCQHEIPTTVSQCPFCLKPTGQAPQSNGKKPEHPCMGCEGSNWVLIPGGVWSCGNCLPVEDSATPKPPQDSTDELKAHFEQTMLDGDSLDDSEGTMLSAAHVYKYLQKVVAAERHRYAQSVLEGLLKHKTDLWDDEDETWYEVVATRDIKAAITAQQAMGGETE